MSVEWGLEAELHLPPHFLPFTEDYVTQMLTKQKVQKKGKELPETKVFTPPLMQEVQVIVVEQLPMLVAVELLIMPVVAVVLMPATSTTGMMVWETLILVILIILQHGI